MLGSARELDHHHHHLHHYYYQQQLGAINNYCSVQQPEFFKEQLIGAAAAAAVDDLDLDHHQQRQQQLQQHHYHLQQQQQRLYGVLEPTSVLDLWSPSPSSKGGGCCSGVSSSGGQLNNDHVAARLAAAAAAAAAAHGSPTSFDSNASEKSVEAARRFLDQEEEEQRRRRWKTGGGGAKNAAVSSRWKSGEEAEAERREMLARRARDKSLDEWLADLQQQKLLHLPAAEEELELTRGLFFQSPPASSSSNTAATGHRRGAEVEIFPPPPPASSAGALEQGYGIEELERMLLSPGGGGGGGGAAAANHQLAKWLLGEQQDHQFFPAKEEDLVPSGFVAKDSTIFFPQASAPTPSFFDPAALLPVIQQQAAVLPPPRARIVPQHQDISLEQLFHPPPLVDPAQFFKNGIAANAGLGHFAERSVPGESRLARHRVEGQSFQSQVLDWEIDRKRKSPQLENHYPPKLLELASPRNTAAAAAGANPFDSSPPFAVSPWQHCAEQNRPQSKLQRLDNNRYSRCRNEATAAAANPAAAAAAAAPAPFPAAIPANVAVSVPDEGLGLMDQLLHLAQAIDVGSNDVAQSILARLNQHLFCHQGKRIQRLAFYFKEALAARMADQQQQQQQEHHLQHRSSNFDLPPPSAKNNNTNTTINGVAIETSSFGGTSPAKNNDATPSSSIADIFTGVKAYTSYCELSPLLRFAYLSANQAILESIQGEASVHIIDFDPGFGSQWPALLEDIAKTPASLPQPRLRLTLVGPDRSRLEFVAESLGEYAAGLPNLRHSPRIGFVQCSHPGVVAAAQLGLAEGEPVVVNFMFSLHRSLAVPGGADGGVRGVVAATSPRLVTVAEQEVDDNDGKFQRRFVETLQYYAFVLDSLGPEDGAGVLTVERDILAPDIANAVSAEGWRRTERHERLAQWRVRLGRAGLEAVPMGEAARMQAECLIKGHSHGKNFEVCREEGGLLLGWQGKPLVAVSSWTPASCSSSAMEGSNTSNTNNNNDNNNVNNSSGNININNNV